MITVTRTQFHITQGISEVSASPQVFSFPGGEVGVKFNPEGYNFKFADYGTNLITARITNSNDVMALAMVRNALDFYGKKTDCHLVMPYCPYARQDRVCVEGEPFALKAFANLINNMDFKQITVFDPHSDVVGAVFNNIDIIKQSDIIRKFDAFDEVAAKGTFISPDAGANKKTAELAKYYQHNDFLRADKLRELATGKIIETIVYADRLDGRTIIIADDICDGGRTFTQLASVLKAKGAAKVVLYITHAIFSAGVDVLFNGGIDAIYTTNSYRTEYDPRVTVLNLEKNFDF